VAEAKPLGDAGDLTCHVRDRHGGDKWCRRVQRVYLSFRMVEPSAPPVQFRVND
jgi:hypothetical protein